VSEVRAKYGDFVVMIGGLRRFITTMNFFASTETSASGERIGREHEPGEDIDLVAHHQPCA